MYGQGAVGRGGSSGDEGYSLRIVYFKLMVR